MTTEDGTIAFIPLPEGTQLYRCPLCSCAVPADDVREHTAWHEGERMRNFTGF